MNIKQYDMIRVRKLLRSSDQYDGWGVNKRAPEFGDIGCVVEILSASDSPDGYAVEAVEADGYTIWLSCFRADEIEAITDMSAAP